MKSIRLSLIVYFLVLLALALGAVSAVVYQTSHQSLLAKEASAAERLRDQFKIRSQDERDKVDAALRAQVERLANQVQEPWGRNQYQNLYLLGLLSTGTGPQGFFQVPIWLSEVVPGPLAYRLNRTFSLKIIFDTDRYRTLQSLNLLAASGSPTTLALAPLYFNNRTVERLYWRLGQPVSAKILFSDDVLPGNAEHQNHVFSQVAAEDFAIWQRSRSLGDLELALPKDAQKLESMRHVLSETQLKRGVNVRVITLKSQLPRFLRSMYWGRRPNQRAQSTSSRNGRIGNGTDRRRGRGSRPAGVAGWGLPELKPPTFFIQYAIETKTRDLALARLKTDLDDELANLTDESTSSLASLRTRLLWIMLGTFAATVAGGYWLVCLGLAPLRRLSDAVSRVSEKDFRLQVDLPHLPSELEPIVDRLNQTLEMLKRAFSREKQAAADISHELRTPLAALMTTTEVALRKKRTTDEYVELLQDCRESGKQMSQLVERLLALARLDAGVDNLRPSEVDVSTLAEQCASLVRPLAEARGITVRVHPNDEGHIVADPDKLREILINLLHNAIQYNRPDGKIDLVVTKENGHLRVEVCDTGIGIPEAAREHIFERFYRADPSRQADGLHAGLGLAIVKGYVDLMGATIGVDSKEGEGTRFRLQFPAPVANAAAAKPSRFLATTKI